MSERITINLTEPKEEITFTLTDQKEEVVFSFSEAARGPQGEPGSAATVDQTIIDGSTNAVSGNAVFDGLALKAPIANPTFTGIVTAPRITGRCDGMEVLCKAGLAINAGQVVYVTGASGNNIIIGLAQANAELTSSKTIGISESTLANNATGYVITEGLLTVSISAPAATEGDPIWLSPTTAGGMVFGAANKPVAPNHMVYLGVVTRKTGNTIVEIFVKVQNGSELEELADVLITSPTSGQALMRGASLWENRSLVAADISDSTTAGRSLITAADAAAQRTALGLGTAATTNTGTGATNTILGNDARLTDARTPLSHTHGNITNDGKIGTTATLPIITTTGGTLTTGSFGTTAGTFTQGDDSRLTDERVPTAAGIASKINGATAKTTLVDADETLLTDSAASFGLKKVTWLNVWNYIVTKIGAITSITAGGAWSFSSTTRPTSSGTGVPISTSLMTRNDVTLDRLLSVSQLIHINAPSMTTSSASGGFAGGGNEDMNLLSGTTASGYARAQVMRDLGIYVPSGSNASCQIPMTFAFPLVVNIPASANTEYAFVVGEVGTGAPIALGTNPLAGRGFGFRMFYSVANARNEVQLFAHDGTSYSESSAIAMAATTVQPVLSIVLSSDGSGNIKLLIGTPVTPNWQHVKPSLTPVLTLATGPSTGTLIQPFASHIVRNGSTPPSAPINARPKNMIVEVGNVLF